MAQNPRVTQYIHTSHYEVSVGEDGFRLHENPGMPIVKEVKHSICVDPNWLLCPSFGLLDSQLTGLMLTRPRDVTGDGGGLTECQTTPGLVMI